MEAPKDKSPPLKRGPVSMQDIADRLSIHQSTVSLALRDSPRISEATRNLVSATAREMGYQPNPLVSALMQSRKRRHPVNYAGTIAYLTFASAETLASMGPIYSEFYTGAMQQAQRLGFKCEEVSLKKGCCTKSVSRELWSRGVPGVVVSPLVDIPDFDLSNFQWELFSSIALGPTLRAPKLHRVLSHHYQNLLLAYSKCRASGHCRIGLCFQRAADNRTQGIWKSAYLGARESIASEDRISLHLPEKHNREEFLAWIQREKPTAIIVARVSPALEWLESANIQVPEDISVVTCCLARQDGPVSGIIEDGHIIAQKAMNQLASLIHQNEKGIPSYWEDILVCGKWNPGKTLGSSA